MAKKSAIKVVAAPVVEQSVKKGKREAEVAIEKASAKKQKKDEAVQQSVEKKKKVESSSSDDSDSSDDETKAKVTAKKEIVKESSSDDSSSDDEPAPPAKMTKESSSDSESSDSDSEEDEKPKAKTPAAKNGTLAAAKKEESDDSSSDSDSEEEKKSKAKSVATKNGTLAAAKKSDSDDTSNEDDSDDSSSEEEAPKAKVSAAKSIKTAKSSSDSSEESSEEEDDKLAKNTVAAKKEESSDDSSDDDSSEDEKPAKPATNPNVVTKQTEDSDDSSSDEEESDESDIEIKKEQPKTPKKTDTDVEMVDADSGKKAPKTPSTPQSSGSATLFAGNLSFRIDESDLKEFFKSAGKIIDIRFGMDPEGTFKGYGHIEFESEAAAQEALKLHGTELLGRSIKLDVANQRGSFTPSSGGKSDFKKLAQTVFIKGLDSSLGVDELRGLLEQQFGKCGEITRMTVPKDYESGQPKGFAYIDFSSKDELQKALELNNTELNGSYMTVDEATPRSDRGGPGRGRFGDSGGRSSSGGRFSRGRDGGGRFSRGRDSGGRRGRFGDRDSGNRGRGTFNKPSLAAAGTGKKTTFDD